MDGESWRLRFNTTAIIFGSMLLSQRLCLSLDKKVAEEKVRMTSARRHTGTRPLRHYRYDTASFSNGTVRPLSRLDATVLNNYFLALQSYPPIPVCSLTLKS